MRRNCEEAGVDQEICGMFGVKRSKAVYLKQGKWTADEVRMTLFHKF